jgi:hypothetical protein
MSLFKLAVLQTNTLRQLKTLRYQLFAISEYITITGNRRLLNLSLNMKRRKWIKGIWTASQNFSWSFVPSYHLLDNFGFNIFQQDPKGLSSP